MTSDPTSGQFLAFHKAKKTRTAALDDITESPQQVDGATAEGRATIKMWIAMGLKLERRQTKNAQWTDSGWNNPGPRNHLAIGATPYRIKQQQGET